MELGGGARDGESVREGKGREIRLTQREWYCSLPLQSDISCQVPVWIELVRILKHMRVVKYTGNVYHQVSTSRHQLKIRSVVQQHFLGVETLR